MPNYVTPSTMGYTTQINGPPPYQWPRQATPIMPGQSVTNGTNSLPAGPVTSYDPAYGGIPSVPSPSGTQTDSLLGNLGNLNNLYNLTIGASGASAAGAQNQITSGLPEYQSMIDKSSGNISSLLKGEIPQDVQNLIAQQAAERGVSMGSPGSDNSNTALMRMLGLTSLGLQQQGEGELSAAVGRTPTGPAFNPATMLLDPNSQQMWQYLATQLKAAPVPSSAAAANLNSLLAATRAGQTAAGPKSGGPINFGAGPTSTGAGSQALGFGPTGMPPINPANPAGGSGSLDMSEDPSQWLAPEQLQQWNAMSPDQQYEEQLMGYPSFTDTGAGAFSPQPSETGVDYTNPGADASDPGYWDMSNLYG